MMNTVRARRKPLLRAAAFAVALLALLAGCERTPARDYAAEGEAWKARIADAYERNASLDNYRFEGSIAFPTKGEPTAAAGPAALLPMLGEGLSWSGILYRDPLRLEADVRFEGTAGGDGAAAQSVPLLAQDGLLYVSIPPVNAPDEYFAIDLAEAEAGTGPLPIRPLLDAAAAFDDLAYAIVDRVDPQWIRTPDVALDGDGGAAESDPAEEPRRFVVEVTEENAEHVAAAFREGYAVWAERLPPELGADRLSIAGDASFSLAPGGSIAISLDENGYVVDQAVELDVVRGAEASSEDGSATDASSSAENASSDRFAYAVRLTEPNGSPELTKTVPPNVIPFKDVLAFLLSGADAANP
ncbi:hypothetical protein FE782_20335 [Paenibacillus antri]|uniref:Uncharacterized protein n=1 Tax=Paenibacillus antri TaxID=2582848 RepID=A0A5R9GAG1_9BACL|nr:hypothetical protein [Paenibacillus antri]TLS50378.1 hypothetical protein FE782_20335 [Paenibacillus antri]